MAIFLAPRKLIVMLFIFTFTLNISVFFWALSSKSLAIEAPLTLEEKIGQMILVGVKGTTPEHKNVKRLKRLIEKNLLGGVIFFPYNIKGPKQFKRLVSFFKDSRTFPLLAIDQEGGYVQRLARRKGFLSTPSPYLISKMPAKKVYESYLLMAYQSKSMGITINLGPVVDLYHRKSPAIGRQKRSYGANPYIVTKYARFFLKAHQKAGVLTCLKHFPGHGLALKDSHLGHVDITDTFSFKEILPFKNLIENEDIDLIMSAHILNRNWDGRLPISLSPLLAKKLRQDLNYQGAIITDDLSMNAISLHFSLEETVIKAILAGNDLLLFSQHKFPIKEEMPHKRSLYHYRQRQKDLSTYLLTKKIISIVKKALKEGQLDYHHIEKANERIKALKNKVKYSNEASGIL